MAQWWFHLLMVGSASLVVPTLVLLTCLRWGWTAFAEDFPEDVQALLPEPTRAEVVRGRVLGPIFLLSLLAVLVTTTATWEPARDGFLAAWSMALGVTVLFCLVDLVIVDWVVVCTWRPSWVTPRGTETAAGWDDYGFHLRAQLAPKGLAVLMILPLVLAAAVTVLW